MRRFLYAIALLTLPLLPASADEPVDAVWKEQKVEIGILSLKVAYTCELMEARIKMLLRHVGAADDVALTVSPCGGFDRPTRQHQVEATFSTLVPAGDGDADIVKAEWSVVELGKRHPRSIDDRDCELLEQFQKNLLSTIEHEVIEGSVRCNATRQSTVGLLKLRVLKPVAKDTTDTP